MIRFSLFALLSVVLLSGCRTYGGYDSKDLTAETIADLAERVNESLTVAEGELELLEAAATSDNALTGYMENFSALVEHHRDLASRLTTEEVSGGYRSVSRAFGAAVTDFDMVSDGYARTKADIAMARGIEVAASNTSEGISYGVVPPFFRRVELNRDLTMRDVLS